MKGCPVSTREEPRFESKAAGRRLQTAGGSGVSGRLARVVLCFSSSSVRLSKPAPGHSRSASVRRSQPRGATRRCLPGMNSDLVVSRATVVCCVA